MNMEAMGIFNSSTVGEEGREDQLLNNISCLDPQQHHSLAESRNNPASLNRTSPNINNNPSIITNKPKVESKDHRWKEAPILGMEEKPEL